MGVSDVTRFLIPEGRRRGGVAHDVSRRIGEQRHDSARAETVLKTANRVERMYRN
jgi:hypothetical protein